MRDGFLGPNGAGKTTTMRMILGLDAPTKGTALVNGKSSRDHKFPLHEVGALLDANALHDGRRAFDHLLCLAQSNGIVWIRTLLRHLASEGRTVFVSSHLMTEMAMTADRLIVVGRGKLIADATVEEFTAQGEHWIAVQSSHPAELATILADAGATVHTVDDAQQIRGLTPIEIGDLALSAGIAIYGLTEKRATLEEVFFGLTGDSVEYHGMLGSQNGQAA